MKGTTFGLTSLDGTRSMIKEIKKIYDISEDTVFLDIGSGSGEVVYDFQQETGIKRSIGVEFQKCWYDKTIKQFTNIEVYFDDILNRLDLVKKANIIYLNNICIPSELFWDCFEVMKKGTVVVFNKQSLSKRLKNSGYELQKFTMDANNVKSKETLLVVK